jgi:hypothetical protein
MPNNQLDQGAVNLAKAIREAESGGNWNAKGGSGEFGAYQFTPATWSAYSREFGVNAAHGAATPDQQNEVAYKKIKQWKDQGYDVGQIASMWNAGVGRPNAHLEGHKGVNKFGVEYDTPAYAEKVARAYQRLKLQSGVRTPEAKNTIGEKDGGETFAADAGNTLAKSGTKLANVIGQTASGQINPLSGLIQGAGAIAGGFTGLVDDALTHTPIIGGAYKGLTDIVGKGVEGALGTETGQRAVAGYQGFAERHPELAGNIEAGLEVVGAVPAFKGIGIAKNKAMGAVGDVLHGKTDDVLEYVKPHMTPKDMTAAIQKQGTEKRGLLGEIAIKDSARDKEMADYVRDVKGFNPSKGIVHNVTVLQSEVQKVNRDLKQAVQNLGENRIYSYKELGSALRNIDLPDVIAEDAYLAKLHSRLVARALEIAKKKGGKVPNLIDVRQEFDAMVKKQYPNIWNNMDRTSPLKESVRNIREALTNFTVKNLPDEANIKATYRKEHLLLEAIENLAEKASKGETKEIGTNALSRFGKRHPLMKGLVKVGGNAAIQGAGIGGVMKVLD